MLMAQDQQDHLILAADATRQAKYRCPGCQGMVRLKRGRVMAAHFAHQAAACQTFSEGETAEHLLGKQQLAAWFQASGYTVQIEAALPALHQRPDVLVQQGSQPPLALEFQCSPLSVTRLAERTQGYRQHGYRVLWVLGSPYHVSGRLRSHAKALKFLQYSPQWGCYLVFWDVTGPQLQLDLNLLSCDGDPLHLQRHYFPVQRTTVPDLLHYRPQLTIPTVVANHYQAYQRRLTLGRLGQQPQVVALQRFCYQHGGTVATMPDWVYPMIAKVPILAGPYLSWYLHVFVRLRLEPLILSTVRLQQLLQAELTPLLAPVSCLNGADALQQQLVHDLLAELVTRQVITAVPTGWRLNSQQLRWKRH